MMKGNIIVDEVNIFVASEVVRWSRGVGGNMRVKRCC